MRLNTLQPARGAKKKRQRLGRGIGSGSGKTCGRGHKGQHSRAGGYHKIGFEGGQMPLQRRIPKFGFNSRKARATEEIRLKSLNQITDQVVDISVLKYANLVKNSVQRVRVFLCGSINKAITIRGLQVTKGAKAAIENAGGTVEE